MKNDFEPRGNRSITVWNGKKCVSSDTENIRQTIERVLPEKSNLPRFYEYTIPSAFFS
jgi:hypothetical protein